MKNLMIAAVLSLGTMTAFAQHDENAVEEAGTAVEENATDASNAVEDTAADASEATPQEGFKEVATEEVPEAVTTALEEAHPGATIDKASMNDQSQYKLEVTKEDGETAELYMDAEGNKVDM